MFRLTICSALLCAAGAGASAQDASQAIQPADPQLGRAADFNIDVFPMFESKCLACHNATTAESDLVLENVESVLKGGGSGPAVVPGNPDESYLYKVAARAEEPHMPPLPNKVAAKALTPQELGVLRQWITEGAKPGAAAPMNSAVNWQPVPASIQSVFSLALDPQERFLAAGRANRIVLFDIAAQQEVAQLTDPALLSVMRDGAPIYGPGIAHQDFVHALAFSPDGNLLASAGYRVVKLWERQRNIQLQKFTADAPPTAVAVSSDGTLAATAYPNGQIRLWNLATGQPGPILEGNASAVNGLAFNGDATVLVSGAEDNSLRTWNVADGQALATAATPAPIRALVLNQDGTQVVTGHADNIIRVWPLPQPDVELAVVREITGHGGPVQSLVRMPTTNEVLSGSDDATVRVWNLDNGQQAFSQNIGGLVTAVAVSADGTLIAGSGANNITRIWTRANNQQKAEIKGDPALDRQLIALTDEQTVSKSRQTLADTAQKDAEKDVTSRDESLKKANEQKEAADKALAEAETKIAPAEEAVKTATDELAAAPEDENLKKKKADAEAALQKEVEARDKAKEAVTSAERAVTLSQEALTASQQRLAESKQALETATTYATEMDQKVNTAKEQAAQTQPTVRALAFSLDGAQLATGGDQNVIHLWSTATGRHLEALEGHAGAVTELVALEGGSLLSASADLSAVLWETRPNWKLVARLGASPENPLDISASPFVDRVLCLDFSPDGTKLATGGGDPSRSGQLHLWDVPNRTIIREFTDAHSDTVFDVEFSWNGQRLVSGAADKFIKVFNVEDGGFIRAYEGHTSHVMGVAWKADDSVIASAGADNAIKLWNTTTGEQIRTITGYNKQVTDVDYVGVQDIIVTAGGDKQVRTYNGNNGSPRRQFGGNTDFVYAVTATRDESLVISAGEDGVIRIWNGTNGQEIAKFEPPAPAAETASAN